MTCNCESFKRVRVIFVILGQIVAQAYLKLNDLIGKVKAEFMESESTIFTVQEITDAFGFLKAAKAAGCDRLSAEAVRVCSSSDYLL